MFPTNKHGCQKRGRNLKFSEKKAVFLASSGKKLISLPLVPLEKPLEKSDSCLLGKIPSDADAHKHAKLHHFFKKCIVLHHVATLLNNTNAVRNP